MLETVDIHSHILHGIDNGADSSEEMKQMIDSAYADGVRHICLTPHYDLRKLKDGDSAGAYEGAVCDAFSAATEYAKEKYPDLSLYLGNEFIYHSDTLEFKDINSCRTINNSSYILVEFPHDASLYDIRNCVSKIVRNGYIPVIAHVERYEKLLETPNFAWELKQFGALLQVDASTIEKMKFGRTKRVLKFLFRKSYVDVVASNSHAFESGKPYISLAVSKISRLFGEETAKRLFFTAPLAILNNKRL